MTDETTHVDCGECIEESKADTHPVFACAECRDAWEPDSSEIEILAHGDGTFSAECPRSEDHQAMTAECHFEACDDPNCPDVVRSFSRQAR